MDIYNISEIEKELRATADAACRDGVDALLLSKGITIDDFIINKEKYNTDFIKTCHDGFKTSQDRIIKNVLLLQKEHEIVLEELKQARKERNKNKIDGLIKKDEHIRYVTKLFKHCADALMWQLIHGQLWISRRLHLNVGGQKKLKDINLKSVKTVADQINSNPMNFVLITDLTNNVQVGDLIGIEDGKLKIIEVKEGNKNYEILEIIHELNTNQMSFQEMVDKYNPDHKFIEHIKRTIKQQMTLQNVQEILNTDTGIDPTSQEKIKIYTPKEPVAIYTERLSTLEKQLKSRNFWAYDVIDNCLHIGIYKGEKRFVGASMLKALAEESKMHNYIIIDILSVFESLNKPIFFLPFSPDFIFDLIFCRTKMYFMLDLDRYIELYKDYGFIAEWADRKETAKTSCSMNNYGIFKLNNRGIKIKASTNKKFEVWLSGGFLTRIFFEQVYPSYMAYSAIYFQKDE